MAENEEQLVRIPVDAVNLEGNLVIPQGAEGIVVFAHGSGSSRHSPRNRAVAREIENGGLATLLMDLLTAEEEEVDVQTRQFRFDIDLLANRLIGAIDWLTRQKETRLMNIGGFGSSTGAAAALIAAAKRPTELKAVVSRGGRPDLAGRYLAQVTAPSLLIVGGRDTVVIRLNEEAMAQIKAEKKLEIIPGATHLFPEPGALDTVSSLARQWFEQHLTGRP